MSELRALIVDDEAPARARLRELLTALDVEICGEAENGRQALTQVAALNPDVLLLDIRMPGIDGITVARELAKTEDAPPVVFCTAFDDQALAAFDAQAVDYLLKPIALPRLQAALQRVMRILGREEKISAPNADKKQRTHLSVRARGAIKLVPITDVSYLQADTKYVEVHTASETYLLEESLVQLEEEFSDQFLRIHRNCLVAKQHIAGLERKGSSESLLMVKCGEHLAALEISRRNLAQVKKTLLTL